MSGGDVIGGTPRGAVLSECGTYRYALWRIWKRDKGIVCWVMLNPSTADANVDDPTIRRLIGFTEAWGYGGLVVGNLFAYRATDPRDMAKVCSEDKGRAVGPDNDQWIKRLIGECVVLVGAWGAHGVLGKRSEEVLRLGRNWHCLGITKQGQPVHPLYQRRDIKPVLY